MLRARMQTLYKEMKKKKRDQQGTANVSNVGHVYQEEMKIIRNSSCSAARGKRVRHKTTSWRRAERSDNMPGIFVGHTVISRSSRVHAHRSFIHPVVIDNLTPKHSSAGFPLPKDWGRITPEIPAIGDYSSRERISRSYCTWVIPQPIPCCRKESVNSKKGRPLLNAAMFATTLAMSKSRVWPLSSGREASGI